MVNRATFDPLLHEIRVPLANDDEGLQFVRGLTGTYLVQNQILHEYTHYFCSESAVTRAIRVLKISALLTYLKFEKASQSELQEAYYKWYLAETITQYLLPIYEGMALLAEFDLCAIPLPEEPDIVFHHHILLSQAVNAKLESISYLGFHNKVTSFEDREKAILDIHLSRISDNTFQSRKKALHNMPLDYNSPDNCYLVGYLFCRQLHTRMSAELGKNADVGLFIKYLRDFFLEDWGLVQKILDLSESAQHVPDRILEHLYQRILIFFQNLNVNAIEAYRKSVIRYLYDNLKLYLFEGLFQTGLDTPQIANRLEEAESFYGKATKDDKFNAGLLTNVQSRRFSVPIYYGEFLTSVKEGSIYISSNGEQIQCNIAEGEKELPPKLRKVEFFLCHVHKIPRVVLIHDKDSMISGWIGTDEKPDAALLLTLGDFAAHKSYLESIVEQFSMDFESLNYSLETTKKASEQACNLYRYFIDGSDGFGSMLKEIAEFSGMNFALKGTTSISLLKKYFSKNDFTKMVLHSSLYGIGYNLGYLADKSNREIFLNGEKFLHILKAHDKLLAQGIEPQFFDIIENISDKNFQDVIFQF